MQAFFKMVDMAIWATFLELDNIWIFIEKSNMYTYFKKSNAK